MDSTNRDAVEELLQTYGETGGINYLAAAATLPSRLAIEAACAELMSLMFPGFRSQALLNSEDLTDTTRTHIRNLHARLKTEIRRSFGKTLPDDAAEAKAEEVLSVFFEGVTLSAASSLDGYRRRLRRRPGRQELRRNHSGVSGVGSGRDSSNGTPALRESAIDPAHHD